MPKQVPSIGCVVHYVAYGSVNGPHPAGVCRAATITEVDNPKSAYSPVGLCVQNPTGLYFNQHTLYSEDNEPGTWHWPEYVPPIEDEQPTIQPGPPARPTPPLAA